uniref:Uncharacterized protein n=1 Tax=Oryza nivara TaxID=4536 RepID=A0A0E0HA62_ORYNI
MGPAAPALWAPHTECDVAFMANQALASMIGSHRSPPGEPIPAAVAVKDGAGVVEDGGGAGAEGGGGADAVGRGRTEAALARWRAEAAPTRWAEGGRRWRRHGAGDWRR